MKRVGRVVALLALVVAIIAVVVVLMGGGESYRVTANFQNASQLVNGNLVETVKGYATHEREVFEKTSQARAAAMSARGVNETQAAEGQLTAALTDLRAVAENYPTLRATENFQQLTRSLSELEDEIQASRRIYNSNVQSYNTTIQQFPSSIVASQGDFTAREFFEIENAAEREPVQVSFS